MTSPAKLLTNRKLRVTLARLNVLGLLTSHPRLSPKDTYRLLDRDGNTLSVASIHRVLAELCDAGLIERHYLSAGVASYSLRQTQSPVHLVCHRCGSIDACDDPALGKIFRRITTAKGFAIADITVSVRGICASCGAAKKP